MYNKAGRGLVLTAALIFVASSCSSTKSTTASSTSAAATPTTGAAAVTKGDTSSFYMAAASQSGDGKSIKIKEAVLTGTKGWVAIHSDAGGAPGPVIGVSKLLDAGTSTNVTANLDKPLTASATVFPMLHLEDNNNTTYDFPNGDAPAKVGGSVVVFPISVTVQ